MESWAEGGLQHPEDTEGIKVENRVDVQRKNKAILGIGRENKDSTNRVP